jgi:hypothetical protein
VRDKIVNPPAVKNMKLTSPILVMCAMLTMFACGPSIVNNQAESSFPNRKEIVPKAEDADVEIARKVKDVILEYCRNGRKAIAAKEALAAMAAVVGERCIEAAGEFPVRGHEFFPGQRVFSDKINTLLAGSINKDTIAEIPAETVFGTIRDQLAGSRFQQNHYPSLGEIFGGFAHRIGKPEDWGKVPLSLRPEYWPEKLPLRVAFDTRPGVDTALGAIREDKARSLRACTLAMVMLLKDKELANQLDPATALTLTFETINGMAKTAPMKDKAINEPTRAMLEAQHSIITFAR